MCRVSWEARFSFQLLCFSVCIYGKLFVGLYSTAKQDRMAETTLLMTAEYNSLHIYLGSIMLFQVIQEKWY